MKIIEIINHLNNMEKFVNKNYELPFLLRRAIKKNNKVLYEEYSIFDEQRNQLTSDIDSKPKEEQKEIQKKIEEMLNTEVEVEIMKVPVDVLAEIKMPYRDELLIGFMLEEEE